MDKSFEEQTREICDLLSEEIAHSGSRGAVLDLDGGLPSLVLAALARRSLGESLLALIMTSRTSMVDLQDALFAANHLGFEHEELDLDTLYLRFLQMLPKTHPGAERDIIPRLKMTALYHHASARGYLVLGSTTRTDWELGVVTKYGDTGADLFPLIHLLRSDLSGLARYLGLPERLIEKSPPAIPQTGAEQGSEAPFSYDEVDHYLSGNFHLIPEDRQNQIRTMLQAAAKKRRYFNGPLAQGISLDKLSSLAVEHEAYGKSIEALTLISKAITSDQYLEDILRLIVMVTAEVMNSSVCSLWLLDEKEGVMRLRATQSIDQEYVKDRVLKEGEGVVWKVVAENRPYAVPNVLTDPLFREKELARRMGLVSMLSMPMRVKDRVIGVINCYTSQPHAFSDLQMNVLTTVANQAAVAIEKTELLLQTKVIQEELERRKIIERAKDLLMKRLALSGEEAYRWLQKRSMNTRKSMREVSEAVLLAMEG
jgi:NAD+ synthetase